MTELIIAAHAAFGVAGVAVALAGLALGLFALARFDRNKFSAEGRGNRHGRQNKF